jgi:hypothetical protein
MYTKEYLKKNMINLKITPHAQLQPPSITIKNYQLNYHLPTLGPLTTMITSTRDLC